MRLYEHEASALFAREGIPVPDSKVVASAVEARRVAEELGPPVVIKAQVLTGGRGLAGGVRMAGSPAEAGEAAAQLLGSTIRGAPVDSVMVARKVEVARELYLSVIVDGYEGVPRAILSTEGGVSIEELARTHPERVASKLASIVHGLRIFEARRMAREAGLVGRQMVQVAAILHALYRVFRRYDALLAEINPLACTPEGEYMAIDAKLEIDDSSLYRHPELGIDPEGRIENPLERMGRQIGVTYVDLDGEVGIISSGAGLGMASMDIVGRRFRPVNFLETGGAITEELLYRAMGLVLHKGGLRGVFINLYGGINPIHEGARGVVRYIQEHDVNIPVVAKALGNRQEETWEILRQGGVHVVTDVETEKGVEELFRLMEEGTR